MPTYTCIYVPNIQKNTLNNNNKIYSNYLPEFKSISEGGHFLYLLQCTLFDDYYIVKNVQLISISPC